MLTSQFFSSSIEFSVLYHCFTIATRVSSRHERVKPNRLRSIVSFQSPARFDITTASIQKISSNTYLSPMEAFLIFLTTLKRLLSSNRTLLSPEIGRNQFFQFSDKRPHQTIPRLPRNPIRNRFARGTTLAEERKSTLFLERRNDTIQRNS